VQLDLGNYPAVQQAWLDQLTRDAKDTPLKMGHFPTFGRAFLDWDDNLLEIFAVEPEVPDTLKVATAEGETILTPTAAYRHFQAPEEGPAWTLLVKDLEPGTDLDAIPDSKNQRGWVATPHQKFERLLRETGVGIGLLSNGEALRLVYAPKGENSGHLTFPVACMSELRAVALFDTELATRHPAILKLDRSKASRPLSLKIYGSSGLIVSLYMPDPYSVTPIALVNYGARPLQAQSRSIRKKQMVCVAYQK